MIVFLRVKQLSMLFCSGGSFQRQVSIRFKNSDYKFDLRQRFLGIRKESNGDDVVVAHTNFVGLLPEIPENAVIKMPTYTEEYVKKGPGKKACLIDFETDKLASLEVSCCVYISLQQLVLGSCVSTTGLDAWFNCGNRFS